MSFSGDFGILMLMAKLRVGKKKRAATKDSVVVSSEFKKVRKLPGVPKIDLTKLRTRKGAAIACILLLIVAAIVAVIVWQVKESKKPVVTKYPTEQEYLSNKIKYLKDNTPTESASQQDQVKYLDDLQRNYDLTMDYQKAAETFEKRASLQSFDLDYQDYGRAAAYYIKIQDKPKAIAALDKAISLLPPDANEETGYDPALVRETLVSTREGLK